MSTTEPFVYLFLSKFLLGKKEENICLSIFLPDDVKNTNAIYLVGRSHFIGYRICSLSCDDAQSVSITSSQDAQFILCLHGNLTNMSELAKTYSVDSYDSNASFVIQLIKTLTGTEGNDNRDDIIRYVMSIITGVFTILMIDLYTNKAHVWTDRGATKSCHLAFSDAFIVATSVTSLLPRSPSCIYKTIEPGSFLSIKMDPLFVEKHARYINFYKS